jgi:MarR family transcriptional regulator for hemolysin
MPQDTFTATLGECIEVIMRQSMLRFLGYAREKGLTLSHLGAIIHTHHIGSCGVTEIGEHLGVSSAAASQMLERLVQQDLVLRSENPDDRRAKRIALTEKGQRILEEGMRLRQSWLNDVARDLSESEREAIASALKILSDRVKQLA